MALSRLRLGSACAAAALSFAGCASMDDTVNVSAADMQSWLSDKPESAHHLYASVLTGGARNRVLNQMRAGLAAFEAGADDVAARSFDDALNRIESIYADNPRAERARSTFVPERSKEFKGESYERAMAFYYRGLIYLAEGDYGNARAVFQGGQLQDAFAEDQRYQSDFAVLDMLAGWASHCEGNSVLAREFYNRAVTARSDIHIPSPGDRILAIADLGFSPIKEGGGPHGEYLVYLPPDETPEDSAAFIASGVSYPTRAGENLYWQATTRGGRQVDHILAGKAQFKDVAAGVGVASLLLADVALDVASWNAYDDYYDGDNSAGDALAVAAGLAIVGIGALLMSESAAPEADTRYWDNLPATINYTSLPPGAFPIEIVYKDSGGNTLGSDPVRVRIDPKGKCGLVYAKSRPAAEAPASPPNASLRR
jgi:tetratricopeptide (TPR) repeat protein